MRNLRHTKSLIVMFIMFAVCMVAFTACGGNNDPKTFTVTFMVDGVQYGDVQTIESGKAATAPTTNPTKASTTQYTYSFSGWDKDFDNVTSNLVVNAEFSQTLRQYSITFVNWDETVLQTGLWDYGATPVYSGETPEKISDENYDYIFSGWDKEITTVGGTTTYTAQFDPISRGLEFRLINNDTEYEVLCGTATENGATVIYIPSVYENLPVTRIAESAFDSDFYNVADIVNVIMPNTVTSIGNYAFWGCESLSSITIPENVTSIGEGAFGFCTSIDSIFISRIVINIESGAFYEWESNQIILIEFEENEIPEGWVDDGIGGILYAWYLGCDATIIYGCDPTNPKKLTLNYSAGANGTITGDTTQKVDLFGSGTSVTAVADDGFEFVRWSDGVLTATRTDTDVTKNINVSAIFGKEGMSHYVVISELGERDYFSFTPTVSGYYVIESTSKFDTFINLYDNSNTCLNYNDDFGTNANFRLVHFLTAGETYTIETNIIGEIGDFVYTINLCEVIANDFVVLDGILQEYIGSDEIVEIPDSVTGIANKVFYMNNFITRIIIPTSVIEMGTYVFFDWSNNQAILIRHAQNDIPASWEMNWAYYCNATIIFGYDPAVPLEFTLTYTAGANGSITGTPTQTVDLLDSGTSVTAVADDGYIFIAWSDGVTTATRTEINVIKNINVTAIFGKPSDSESDFLAELTDEQFYRQAFAGFDFGRNETKLEASFTGENGINFSLSASGDNGLYAWNDHVDTYDTDETLIITISGTTPVCSVFLNIFAADYDSGSYFTGKSLMISINGGAAFEYITGVDINNNGLIISQDSPITSIRILPTAGLSNALAVIILSSEQYNK